MGGRLSPVSGGYFELRRSAHRGVAGVVYTLARLARFGYRVPGDAQAVREAVGTVADRWRWWCNGSPGIALTFLRLYELTGESRWADLARKALRLHDKGVRAPNLSQCHGLSGLGEIYLEAHRVLGEPEWRERAAHIAATLYHLRRTTETGAVSWLVEDPHVPTADLMVGCGGVLHFLMRFAGAERAGGFPLLLDPVRKEAGKGRRESAAQASPLAP
ncbi:MAG TPA: lanthionine synthetase LanC family protein [Limnochordales bacterium]